MWERYLCSYTALPTSKHHLHLLIFSTLTYAFLYAYLHLPLRSFTFTLTFKNLRLLSLTFTYTYPHFHLVNLPLHVLCLTFTCRFHLPLLRLTLTVNNVYPCFKEIFNNPYMHLPLLTPWLLPTPSPLPSLSVTLTSNPCFQWPSPLLSHTLTDTYPYLLLPLLTIYFAFTHPYPHLHLP